MAPVSRKRSKLSRQPAKDVKQAKIDQRDDDVTKDTAAGSLSELGIPKTSRGSGNSGKVVVETTPGRNYTSHFRSDTVATDSSPSLLDLTVTYDYSTEVNTADSSIPRPTLQQLTKLFPFQDSSKTLSSATNVLSILHELSPAHRPPPSKRSKLSPSREQCKKSSTDSAKVDSLLTQLQQRVSATNNQATGSYSTESPEFSCKVRLEDKLEAVADNKEEDLQTNQSESSDDEEALFWTQAATELDYGANDRGTPQDHSRAKVEEFDSCEPWISNSDAEEFIDQLLMIENCKERGKPSNLSVCCAKVTSSKISSERVNSIGSNVAVGVCRSEVGYHDDNDRCPTPPLPLPQQPMPSRRSQCHKPHPQVHNFHKRPATFQLTEEDTRLTPPISPLINNLPHCSRDSTAIAKGNQTVCSSKDVSVAVGNQDNTAYSSGVSHQCTEDEIERKRRLARQKLARKRNALSAT